MRNESVHYKNLGEHRSEPVYWGKDYTVIRRPVQRLIVLLPVDDAEADILSSAARPGSVSEENGDVCDELLRGTRIQPYRMTKSRSTDMTSGVVET